MVLEVLENCGPKVTACVGAELAGPDCGGNKMIRAIKPHEVHCCGKLASTEGNPVPPITMSNLMDHDILQCIAGVGATSGI